MAKKSSMGRQKIAIAKIPKKNHLQVTFSKRRSGLFKKASELCTLCGVEIAVIVFSPAGKPFSFGHHEVDTVIERFLTRRPKPAESMPACQNLEAHRNNNIRELNFMLTHLLNQTEFERKNGEELERLRIANEKQVWWELPIERLGTGELEQLKLAIEEVRRNVVEQSSMLAGDHRNGNGMALFGTADHAHGNIQQFQDCEDVPEIKPLDHINGGIGSSGTPTFSNYLNFHQDDGIF
ncbi:hypothetical protein MLD38_032416 [Melastoma candidum]|uniref:Uncharacterized protein n=1 Tax=Melastoma candidum TaxID=119954 RepID=A0ACB9M5E1_9MYRT|nr:hypothetical protein MLD38_032416 [Melastoma candidum]